MSLRLKLALAIAAVAGLVAAGIGLVAYDRERAARLDRARIGAASAVREAVKLYDANVPVQDSDAILELTPSSTNPRIPATFRRQIVDNHVYTTFVRSNGVSYVLAGARRRNGGRIYVRQSFASDATALADLRVVLVQVGLAAAALGALLGVAISTFLARPLRRSASLARRLASGDLDARLRPRGSDEAAALGRALDEMAEALGNKLKELDDAAERERRFSSDVAHELRTPVTGMVAAAALLDETRAARMVRERPRRSPRWSRTCSRSCASTRRRRPRARTSSTSCGSSPTSSAAARAGGGAADAADVPGRRPTRVGSSACS